MADSKEMVKKKAIESMEALIAKAEEVVESHKDAEVKYRDFHALSQKMYECGLESYKRMLVSLKTGDESDFRVWIDLNNKVKNLNEDVNNAQRKLRSYDLRLDALLNELQDLAMTGRADTMRFIENYTDLLGGQKDG